MTQQTDAEVVERLQKLAELYGGYNEQNPQALESATALRRAVECVKAWEVVEQPASPELEKLLENLIRTCRFSGPTGIPLDELVNADADAIRQLFATLKSERDAKDAERHIQILTQRDKALDRCERYEKALKEICKPGHVGAGNEILNRFYEIAAAALKQE